MGPGLNGRGRRNGHHLFAADNDWFQLAQCHGLEPELFFPTKGKGSEIPAAICGQCPVEAQCRDWAMETRLHVGVAGGLTAKDRETLRANRNKVKRALEKRKVELLAG